MSPKDLDSLVPSLARNELFYFVARLCMIIGLPLAGFVGARIISQSDTLQSTVAEQNVSIKILSITLKDKLDANLSQLSDHELRLRALESHPK